MTKVDQAEAVAKLGAVVRRMVLRLLKDAMKPADDADKWASVEAVYLLLRGQGATVHARRSFYVDAIGIMARRGLGASPVERLALHDVGFRRLSDAAVRNAFAGLPTGRGRAKAILVVAAQLAVDARALDLGKRGSETREDAVDRAAERLREARKRDKA